MINNAFTDLTIAQLKRAVAIKERIEDLESELSKLLGKPAQSSISRGVGRPTKRRKMSAASRAKIAAAARARWARVKAAKK